MLTHKARFDHPAHTDLEDPFYFCNPKIRKGAWQVDHPKKDSTTSSDSCSFSSSWIVAVSLRFVASPSAGPKNAVYLLYHFFDKAQFVYVYPSGGVVPATDASRQELNEALVWGTDMVSHFLSDENGGDPVDPVITLQCRLRTPWMLREEIDDILLTPQERVMASNPVCISSINVKAVMERDSIDLFYPLGLDCYTAATCSDVRWLKNMIRDPGAYT
ncbi:hypothetical protein CNMCM5793_005210 [Aspergillus hiratsukae]|uniref:Uncharacterized protein n=1 Tax=Aspergillus hiratsukae TaxID=1194566 RepID=A0A8H6PGJ5_9EURO|nr:hypothetical protein CNMCM5793_005210 [Aspergillus hiratsukae]KAF7173031.1 hypothetical protein CNMCM6106_007174 [Aspergillus hiratsukae]